MKTESDEIDIDYTQPSFEYSNVTPSSYSLDRTTIDAIEKLIQKSEERNKTTILMLVDEVRELRKEVAELRSKAKWDAKSTILPKEPFSNYDKFMEYEKSLQNDKDKLQKFISDIKKLGDSNVSKFVRLCWKTLMTDKLGERFSWRGTDTKESIRSWEITSAIRHVVIHERNGKELEFITSCKAFFQFAKNRQIKKIVKQ